MEQNEAFNKTDLARIRWRCHRGMLELDLFLLNYFDNCFTSLSEDEKHKFEHLLTEEDPSLFSWILGHTTAPNEHSHIISLLQQYHATPNR
jgi:antitoxin CptB